MDKYAKEDLGRLWHIYSEALRSRCFIYHKGKREWYTPEEFKAKYERVELTVKQELTLLEDLVIRDPIAGITAAHKQITEAIVSHKQSTDNAFQKLNEFNRKVILYYQNKLANKR